MITMRLLHAIAAVLTIILFFIRQRCAIAAASPVKRRTFEASPCSCGDASLTRTAPLPAACLACARAACLHEQCGQPRYKRDPEIRVDNEHIGQHPHG